MAFLPLFFGVAESQTQGMDFLLTFPAIAAAVVGLSGIGLLRLIRSDGFHSVAPPPGHAAWRAGALPSAPYAGAFPDAGV